ncbi:MAG TPA: sulfotransferase domain-containing protein [Accumulibacter sp.]|nr:sulfotransferase domain-containing protein [Accumulibacter sp.]
MYRPNLVIAGVPKAGTTSLFRYLSEHPDICASSVKEIRFFTRHHGRIDETTLLEYAQYFPPADARRYRMEASPGYLFRAGDIAEEMRSHLPQDTRLLFLLREPVARLLSFYFAQMSKVGSIRESVTFDDYVRIALDGGDLARVNEDTSLAQNMVNRVYEGLYADSLRQFMKFWPRAQLFVGFMETMQQSPRVFMSEVCKFLNVDPGFYERYSFPIENRTQAPRFGQIHRFVHGLNRRFESDLNRLPALRRAGRTVYNALLTTRGTTKPSANPETRRRLRDFYAKQNKDLISLCIDELGVTVPDWLAQGSETAAHSHRSL